MHKKKKSKRQRKSVRLRMSERKKEIAKQLERKNQKYAEIDIDIRMKNVSKMRKMRQRR